ncbi:MAG: hypothetical protein OJF55_001409 [Rhodanobacteraceae bacterium]|nr:MAG: hypothetical protein OJF55_001409 [Rhodanobacteraceae bacterium]
MSTSTEDQTVTQTNGDIDSPLVTFALLAYNQERYVDAAIEAALAQTWCNLEIILSDDCSSDSTFQIMEARSRSYRGPHKIRLNRNTSNLGIASHVNTVISLASGRLVVPAAGDDISKPSRTTRIVEAWRNTGYGAACFHSGFEDMETDGTLMGTYVKATLQAPSVDHLLFENVVVGATEAWTREVWDFFGPLNPSVTHEDRNMAVRAALLDGIHYIPESLVARRRGGVSANAAVPKRVARYKNAIRYTCDIAQSICDFHTALSKGLIDERRYASLLGKVSDRLSFETLLLRDTGMLGMEYACLIDILKTFRRTGFALYKAIRLRSAT